LHRSETRLLVKVKDNGPGIDALNLPDVALTIGYTTAETGGLGYNMMIAAADKVYLATGPEGTMVATEVVMKTGENLALDSSWL
jgi:anti-sigma regulatory factor (Ser/Thr protein kinase)